MPRKMMTDEVAEYPTNDAGLAPANGNGGEIAIDAGSFEAALAGLHVAMSKDPTKFEPMRPATYPATVEKIEMFPGDGKPYLKWTFVIDDNGEYNGRRISKRYYLTSEKAINFLAGVAAVAAPVEWAALWDGIRAEGRTVTPMELVNWIVVNCPGCQVRLVVGPPDTSRNPGNTYNELTRVLAKAA